MAKRGPKKKEETAPEPKAVAQPNVLVIDTYTGAINPGANLEDQLRAKLNGLHDEGYRVKAAFPCGRGAYCNIILERE